MESRTGTPQEPIAIVGIGCRFPGAHGPQAFWQMLCDGVDAITEVPPDRFDIDAVYDARPSTPGKTVTRWGGFLDHVDEFDADFFGISPREAGRMDPQQRLLLEAAWEALEDAGQTRNQLPAGRTGVYVGVMAVEYDDLLFEDPTSVNVYSVVGSGRSAIAGRLSYALGLQGPSLSLDTACSSSLVAIHLACQSLRSGECGVALAGGVNLILLPKYSVGFSQAGMLSPDGRCKAFDARADGFVRSEGAAMIVLKPLSQARADGDPIYALIRGSAVNNDGRSGGLLMTPSQPGQEAVLRAAYEDAGVSPGRVQYVEAHGTGTSAGDPVETRALGAVLGVDRPKDLLCRIGSVKSNIGHTEGAAGVAGVIKTALALKHKVLPPSLHCQEPNPNIPWQSLPLVVQRALSPWPEHDGPALAGVSSFGIAGTNAHLVLEEAPELPALATTSDATSGPYLLPLSAHSQEALTAMARAHQQLLSSGQEPGLTDPRDLCYTASVRRTHHDYRMAVVGNDPEELARSLAAVLREEVWPGAAPSRRISSRARKIVFVCPGQGGQWFGMARQLLDREPVFRATLEACDQAMRRYVDWSLLDELHAPEASSRLNEGMEEIDVLQPALFAIQVGLAALWRSRGIEPDAVVGHSMGEVAAAYIAGALSLDDAARVICLRSRLLRTVSGQGGMAVTDLTWEQAERAVSSAQGRVAIAAANGPSSTVLSGDLNALTELLKDLERQKVFCRLVRVDVASHSPQMDPLRTQLLKLLDGMRPQHASVPIYSTVSGAVSDGLDMDAAYWMRNLRQPVLFFGAVRQLLDDGHDTFVELSPHPTLIGAVQQTLQRLDREGSALPSLRRGEDERAVLLETLGTLYTLGCSVDWMGLYPEGGRCVPLPLYAWQHERFWLDDGSASRRTAYTGTAVYRGRGGSPEYPLLGQLVTSAAAPGIHLWETDLSVQQFAYLADHCVQGKIVLPAAAYAEMALEAARQAFGPCKVERLRFERALFLHTDRVQRVQVVMAAGSANAPQTFTFQLYSRQDLAEGGAENAPAAPSWTLHAAGTIQVAQQGAAEVEQTPHDSPEQVRVRCGEEIPAAEYYESLRDRGLDYGPAFQGIAQVWRRDGEALARIQIPASIESGVGTYLAHPALLDACFQALLAALPVADSTTLEGAVYLPVGIESLRVVERLRPNVGLWCHTLARPQARDDADKPAGDVYLLDDQGQVLLEAHGLKIRRLEPTTTSAGESDDIESWCYQVEWQEAPLSSAVGAESTSVRAPGRWLIFADAGGTGHALASRLQAAGETSVMVSSGRNYAQLGPRHYQINPAQPDDFQRLLADTCAADEPSYRGIAHLWSLDAPAPEATTLASLQTAETMGAASVLHLVQALAADRRPESPRLWLITRRAQAVGVEGGGEISVAQAPLLGLARVMPYEHPELRCVRVDLSGSSVSQDDELRALEAELLADEQEDEIALRGTARYVPRLVCRPPAARETSVSPTHRAAHGDTPSQFGQDEPFHVETTRAGILDNLAVTRAVRKAPNRGQVEIRARAAGLNFIDVMRAMGIYPGQPDGPVPLGMECAGTIEALGEGVDGFQVGDEVIGVTASVGCSLSRFVTTEAALVVRKPADLTFEEAAALPIAFLTASYALEHLGRIAAGERVLIHAASGGVGLAAVQLAQHAGAEVFATAGSEEKRQFLRSLGVHHVMDSRSLAFADEVMELTGGEGVDVVLNSLAGEAIPKSLAALRGYGRFIEIGKKDIYGDARLELNLFRKNLSYFAVDVDRMILERPTHAGSILREVTRRVEAGTLKSLPTRAFPLAEVTDAFRYFAQAKHIGKIAVALTSETMSRVSDAGRATSIRADATYLITGGLGGLGLRVARWMVEQGARHLVLTGRSAPSSAAEQAVEDLRRVGARVRVERADVAREADVARVLATAVESMPPLRGVIHAAGVLDDGILLQLDQQRLQSVLAPKVHGAWNLHRLTSELPLDFFVLFSSAASLIGSPGQGNYTAANAFLDSLAYCRRARGLPALTINWGTWSEVGLAVRPDRGGRLELRGVGSFTPERGIEALSRLLQTDAVQVAVMRFDAQQWHRFYPGADASSLLAQLMREGRGVPSRSAQQPRDADSLREILLGTESTSRQERTQSYLADQVAKVLRLSASKVDLQRPLNTLGLDSLMAVELKNRIEVDLGVIVSVTDLLQGPTIAALAAQVLQQLPQATTAPGPVSSPVTADPSANAAHSHDSALSFAQERLWFLDQLDPDSVVDNVPVALRVAGQLDVGALQATLNEIVRRHETLRTTFMAVDGSPVPVIAPRVEMALPIVDLSAMPGEDREAEAWRQAAAEARVPFDLSRDPLLRARLLRLADDDHLLVLTTHHIVTDGWSLSILVSEVVALYTAFSRGEPSPLPDLPLQFAQYALWQRQWLTGEVLEAQLAYWRERMAGAPALLDLPTDRPRPPVQTYRGAYRRFTLPRDLLGGLQALSQREGVTLFMTLVAAVDTLLHRYTAQDDMVVGSAIAGRNRPDVNGLIGPFFNILPLRTDLSGDPTFRALLERVQQVTLGAYAHQDVPFEKMVEELQPERTLSFSPLVQAIVHLHNFPLPALLSAPGVELSVHELDTGSVKSDLVFNFLETAEGLTCSLGYSTDLFDQDTVARLEGHLLTLLEGVVRQPDARLSQLPLLTPAERRQLVTEWNATQADYPRDACLHELVEAQVARSPNATALIYEDARLTYAELDRRATLLARRLRALGVGPEVRVALCMERSIEMVVGLLGVLKAGGAYVPLDPASPYTRLAAMLADAQPKVLLTQRYLVAGLPGPSLVSRPVLCLDDERLWSGPGRGEEPLLRDSRPEHIAYVIYTSGSTGIPKGVEVPHLGIVNRLHWMQQAYGLTADDRVLQKTPYTFDVSVWEFFWPLITGATLVVARPDGHQDGTYLREVIREQRITTLHFVPSMLDVFLDQPTLDGCESLRRVMCSGEALPVELMQRFLERLPSVELHNLYGPTEASVDVSAWACRPEPDLRSVPIGRPIANTQLYVLDANFQPAPTGVPGELYIGGVGLARGYLHRPELTAERFVPDPFSREPGARLYRTGDLARFWADGNIEYLGRLDNQVKLRGFRIELGEIEAALLQHPRVRAAVVLARQDRQRQQRLVAYVVPSAGHGLDVADLRGYLGERLPDYMVPTSFVPLAALPLTLNGKVDRKALPEPDWAHRSEAAGSFAAPRTTVQREIAGIWAELLGIEQIGANDNFFDLGGHSLLAMRLIFRIREALQVDLPLRSIFESPTLSGLARVVESAREQEAHEANGAAGASWSQAPHGVDEAPQQPQHAAALAHILADTALDAAIIPAETMAQQTGEPRHIFLTGATGFLGAFLLVELLKQTRAKVHCLVRAHDEREARARLRQHLVSYGLWSWSMGSRVSVVVGDLAQPRLGLTPDAFEALARKIDVVYHAGAQVNFVFPYDALKPANVLGTREVLRLACLHRTKPFHHISTLSVFSPAGDPLGRAIREDDSLDAHLPQLGNGYDQTKWVAEKLVRAAGDRGLPVCIYRPGLVSGHSRSGVSNTEDYLSRMIKGCMQLGSMPESSDMARLTPVDYVSRAIVYLSRRKPSVGMPFHLINPMEISVSQIGDWLRASGYPLHDIAYGAWREELLRAAAHSTDNALYPLLPFLGGEDAGDRSPIRSSHFDWQNTQEHLKDSGIACPAVDFAVMQRYLAYFRRIGFIEDPLPARGHPNGNGRSLVSAASAVHAARDD